MPLHWRSAPLPQMTDPGISCLPFGNGRSYGDSCLNEGGVLLDTRGLDRWISVDFKTGVLRCEAGILLDEILERIVSRGWLLPVVPGTRFITLGGAIANDIHGKNHIRQGLSVAISGALKCCVRWPTPDLFADRECRLVLSHHWRHGTYRADPGLCDPTTDGFNAYRSEVFPPAAFRRRVGGVEFWKTRFPARFRT